MSYLPDEQWLMIKDSIDKKNIARSSRNKKTHCGKGGSVKFPSDYLARKELKAMNGEVKSYRLNEPMTWEDFKNLPDDIKIIYIKTLRERFEVPNNILAKAFGVGSSYLSQVLRNLGLGIGKSAASRVSKKWPKTSHALEFKEWWYGPDEGSEASIDICEEDVKVVEESTNEAPVSTESPRQACVPTAGHLSFNCKAEEALDMVKSILGDKHVHMVITWDTEIEED